MNIIKPNYLSQTTYQLIIGRLESNTIFAKGTGFIYTFQDKFYLVTNRHNITGKDPITNKFLGKNGGIPNIFALYIRLKANPGTSELYNIKLYEDEHETIPKWLVHPIKGKDIDVAVIELETSKKYLYHPINKYAFDNDIPPEVGDDAYVIGYPFDEMRYLGLPIWKKASIATEPTVNEDQLPKLLIDTATRPGLSGSPVIYQSTGVHNLENGHMDDNTIIGTIRGFLGVYSGRIGASELKAQLGIVWKKEVIEEIIIGGKKGNIS